MVRSTLLLKLIEAAEPTALNHDTLIERHFARLAEIAAQISALQAFNALPDLNVELLTGLGFEALVMPRDGAEVTA